MYLLYVDQLNLDLEGKGEKKRKNETCPWLLQAGFHPPGGPGPAPALIGPTIGQLEIRVILHTILRRESRRTQIWHEKQKVYNTCNDDIRTSSSIKSFLRMTSRLLTPLRPSFRKSEYIFFPLLTFSRRCILIDWRPFPFSVFSLVRETQSTQAVEIQSLKARVLPWLPSCPD
jgi:hypothetical protein